MIYDCFTFFNELDLLEIRLNILNEVVDKFVLVEATRTHRGNPKPLYFAKNKNRFAPFLNKIIHIVVDSYEPVEKYIASKDSDPKLHSWAYENFQRHSIIRGLDDLKDEDSLIVSDLDEIPTAETIHAVSKLVSDGRVRRILLHHRSYYLNFCNYAHPIWGSWGVGAMMLSGATFKNLATYKKIAPSDNSVMAVLSLPSPHLVRTLTPDALIKNGGWHFSYMGGIKAIQHKLKQYAHSENSGDDISAPTRLEGIIRTNGDIFSRGDRFYGEDPARCLPNYIIEKKDKYKSLIFPVDTIYLKTVKYKKRLATISYRVRSATPHWLKIPYFFLLNLHQRMTAVLQSGGNDPLHR